MRIVPALVLLLFTAAASAQSQPAEIITQLAKAELAAWQQHDKAAYMANRDAAFMYVGPLGIIEPGHPVDNLMRCTVASVSLEHIQTIAASLDALILIAEQHQDATCFGMKQPSTLNITETYTRRNGEWKLILRTEAPAMAITPSH